MPSLQLRSAGRVLLYILSLMLMTDRVELANANSLISAVDLVSPNSFLDHLSPGHFTIPMTDNEGNVHTMILGTVSFDSWFATTATTCVGTPIPKPTCGWDPSALYDPTGASTNGTYCSFGIKSPINQYTERYLIMPNVSIILGSNNAQHSDLPLFANVGPLLNSTWDGSKQSGMLGLAATVNSSPTSPWNSILNDMSARYSQARQFTLAFDRGQATGGWFTLGDVLPPNALSLTDPSVFKTPTESATFMDRTNSLCVVTASLAIISASSTPEQYIIDSGDIYLRVPSATARTINSAWSPPASPINDESGRWSVACNAAAPAIGLAIGGHVFNINKIDMLVNQDHVCWSSVIDGQNGPYVLGWPLLVNVIVSFNLDTHMMYWQEPPGSTAVVASAPPSSAPAVTATASTARPSALPATTLVTSVKASSTSVPKSPPAPATTSTPKLSSTAAQTTAPLPATTSTSKPPRLPQPSSPQQVKPHQ